MAAMQAVGVAVLAEKLLAEAEELADIELEQV